LPRLVGCDYVLGHHVDLLNRASEATLQKRLTERARAIAMLLTKLDTSREPRPNGDPTVDLSNARAKARIVRYLMRQRNAQYENLGRGLETGTCSAAQRRRAEQMDAPAYTLPTDTSRPSRAP